MEAEIANEASDSRSGALSCFSKAVAMGCGLDEAAEEEMCWLAMSFEGCGKDITLLTAREYCERGLLADLRGAVLLVFALITVYGMIWASGSWESGGGRFTCGWRTTMIMLPKT